MSRPEDIPQDVWEAANYVCTSAPEYTLILHERVARAILTERKRSLRLGYVAGFKASGEGWNGEYPFEGIDPETDVHWLKRRDEVIAMFGEATE